MFEFTRNFYKGGADEGGSESSFTPGQIIIPEQTVETYDQKSVIIPTDILYSEVPSKLAITFDENEYVLPVSELTPGKRYYYGEVNDTGPLYGTYPFAILVMLEPGDSDGSEQQAKQSNPYFVYKLFAQNDGAHTISAKVPEEKPAPKVLSFPKGRTIVSELSRLNKAFGTVSTKKTIIGQLSDIADAAEAGKIGGGSAPLIVHVNNDGNTPVMDKTWQEIYDAMTNNTLVWIKATSTALYTSSVSCSPVLSARSLKRHTEMGSEMAYVVSSMVFNGLEFIAQTFSCDSPDGYPVLEMDSQDN